MRRDITKSNDFLRGKLCRRKRGDRNEGEEHRDLRENLAYLVKHQLYVMLVMLRYHF